MTDHLPPVSRDEASCYGVLHWGGGDLLAVTLDMRDVALHKGSWRPLVRTVFSTLVCHERDMLKLPTPSTSQGILSYLLV